MSDAILSDFAGFFDDVPDSVRRELSYLLLVTSDNAPMLHEREMDVERVARAMFQAQTVTGRIGELVKAAAVFDVYFALDARERFAGMSRPYADHVDAIDAARAAWGVLRRSTLSPAAIAAALLPGAPSGGRNESPRTLSVHAS